MIERDEVLRWIDRRKWIFAKTYAKTTPHEYIWRNDLKEEIDKNLYAELFRIIISEGVWEQFYRTKFKYWYYGEHKYWVMGNDLEKNQVINRADKKLKYS